MKKSNFSYISITLTALLYPAVILIGKIVEYILKSWNPAQVNVHGILAYLAPILLLSFGFGLVMTLAACIFGILGLKTQQKELAQISLLLLGIEITAWIIVAVLMRAIEAL